MEPWPVERECARILGLDFRTVHEFAKTVPRLIRPRPVRQEHTLPGMWEARQPDGTPCFRLWVDQCRHTWSGRMWEVAELPLANTPALREAVALPVTGQTAPDGATVTAVLSGPLHRGRLFFSLKTLRGSLQSTSSDLALSLQLVPCGQGCAHCANIDDFCTTAEGEVCRQCGRSQLLLHNGEEFRTFAGEDTRNHHGLRSDPLLQRSTLETELAQATTRLARLHQRVVHKGNSKDDKKRQVFAQLEQLQEVLALPATVVMQAKADFAVLRERRSRLPPQSLVVCGCLLAALAAHRRALAPSQIRQGLRDGPWRADYHGKVRRASDDAPLPWPGAVPIRQLAAGAHHAVLLARTGRSYVFGRNTQGCLGLGDTIARATPVAVAGLRHVAEVAAGTDHTGWRMDGQVWGAGCTSGTSRPSCCGDGQTLAAGAHHLSVLMADGSGWTWYRQQQLPAPQAAQAIGAAEAWTVWWARSASSVVSPCLEPGLPVPSFPVVLRPSEQWYSLAERQLVPEPEGGGGAAACDDKEEDTTEEEEEDEEEESWQPVCGRLYPPTAAIRAGQPPCYAHPPPPLPCSDWLRQNSRLPGLTRELLLGLAARSSLPNYEVTLTEVSTKLNVSIPDVVAELRQLWSRGLVEWDDPHWVLAAQVDQQRVDGRPPAKNTEEGAGRPQRRPKRRCRGPAARPAAPVPGASPLPLRLPLGWIQRTTVDRRIVYLHLQQPEAPRATLQPLRAGWWQGVDLDQRVIYTNGQLVRYQHPQVQGTAFLVPPGWEQLVDDTGLIFYKDHQRMKTQRHPPPPEAFAVDVPWDPLYAMHALHPKPRFGSQHHVSLATVAVALAPVVVECGQLPQGVGPQPLPPVLPSTVERFWQRVGAGQSRAWQHLTVTHRQHNSRFMRTATSRMSLRASVQLWPHQQQALQRLVDAHGIMRSGLLVVPCGGGKTLLGIAIAMLSPPPVLVLCHNATSVLQWRQQFQQWSTGGKITTVMHTAELAHTDVAILTYKMLSTTTSANKYAQSLLLKRQWSAVLLDEVHGAPSVEVTLHILTQLRAGALIGVTATPLREDSRLSLIDRHVGPLLFEVPWMRLQKEGLLNPIECTAVHCPLVPAWQEAYAAATTEMERQLLSALHPTKVQCCRTLLQKHAKQGVLLFFEELLALQWYVKELGLAFITGSTPLATQTQLLQGFEQGRVSCLAFSRAGDTSLDLPRASVVIQISAHHGSRRQEVQRIGRISRIAPGKDTSRFYTLISSGTKEAEDTVRRQQYPTAQGYAYTQETCCPSSSANHVSPAARLAEAHALGESTPAPSKPKRSSTKKTLRQRLARRK